jgi:hypothetical protein
LISCYSNVNNVGPYSDNSERKLDDCNAESKAIQLQRMFMDLVTADGLEMGNYMNNVEDNRDGYYYQAYGNRNNYQPTLMN